MKNQPKTIISHGEIEKFSFRCKENRRCEFKILITLNTTRRIKSKPVLIDLQFLPGGDPATYPLKLGVWSPNIVFIPDTPRNDSLFEDYKIFYKSED